MLTDSNFEVSSNDGLSWQTAQDPLTCRDECMKNGLPVDWVGMPNRVDLVRGRRAGRAYIILPRRSLQLLGILDGTSESFAIRITHKREGQEGSPFPASLDKRTFSGFQFVQATCLIPTPNPGDWNPYLVEFADVRIYGQLTTIEGAFNTRAVYSQQEIAIMTEAETDTPIYEPCSVNDETGQEPLTWVEIKEVLESLIPFPFEPLNLVDEDFPSTPPINLRYEGVSAWDAYIHFLGLAGITLSFDRIGVSYSIKKSAPVISIDERFDKQSTPRQHVTRTIRGSRVSLPEKTRVFFPKNNHSCYGVDGGLAFDEPLDSCSDLFYHVNVNTRTILEAAKIKQMVPTLAGTIYPLIDFTLFAEFTNPTDSSPVNLSDLQTRANDKASRFIRSLFQGLNNSTVIYGLHEIAPDAAVQRVTFYDLGRGTYTEVYYGWNDNHVPFPRFNAYSSPHEYLTPTSFDDISGIEIEPEVRGLTGNAIRLGDFYLDDEDMDAPTLTAKAYKEIIINGIIIGGCVLDDLRIEGTTC